MKVKEKFASKGLFTAMNDIQKMSYAELIEPVVMDMIYISNYGERTVSVFGSNNDVETVAKMLMQMFYNKWEKLYDMAVSSIDIDYNYSEKVTENIQDDGTLENNLESTNTGSVNAYNDDDFVNDKQDQNTTKNSGTNSNTKNRDYIKQVLQGGKTDYYNKILLYLQNNYFNDIIIRDINNFLTLSIFD